MKTILLTLMLLAGNATTNNTVNLANETYVYICTGPKSKRYHCTKNCRGLNSCSESIEKVTLTKAKELGRDACGICYK